MRILQTLLEISIYAAILFGATMLFKQLLREQLSPFLHYAIWSLFLLRLLLPVTFDSPVQFFTLPAQSTAASVPVSQPENITTPAQDAAKPALALPQSETDNILKHTQTAPAQVGAFGATNQPVSLATVLLVIWLSGVAFGLGYIAYLYIRLQKRIAKNAAKPTKRLRALYHEVRRELGIRTNVPLVCQFGLTSPGILFPACVLMPMELLASMDDEQVKNTLRHELVHYKRGDHIVSIVLSLLNTVYWFNPIVWIAVRQIRADMETLCDSVVVHQMSAKQKGDYATLLLDLFSRSNYRQVVLGMAYGKSKAVVEKRIKGVFMRNRSQLSAKLICFTLSLVMLVGCFTTACVPAKQASNDNPSSDAVAAQPLAANPTSSTPEPTPTPAPDVISPLAQKLGIPTPWRFTEWSTDKELLLNGNLSVTLPHVNAVPIASVTCRDVTKDDLMNTVHAFFGRDVKFICAPEDTKEFAEESLPLFQKIYDGMQKGTNPNKDPKYEKAVKDQLDTYLEMIQSAPSAAEKREVAVKFVEGSNDFGDPVMRFRGVAERDGTPYLVRASYSATASAININELVEDRPLYYNGSRRSEPEGVSMPKEQAIALATELAGTLDSGLSLNHVMTVGLFVAQGEENKWEHPWAWQCVFQRTVNGVGTAYDSRDIASDMETTLTNVRVNEALEITVDDRGIINIHWVNPMTVDSITNPDATLMPFSEIEAKLADLVREKYDYNITREDATHELFIQHAELGLMRIGKPNAKTFSLEPVWNFFIEFSEHPDYSSSPDLLNAAYDGDPVFWNSLTISAIDGHVIDRDRGY
jgi:beta-lactamase regulating signal transducer with metallopeptidase domain